MDDIMTIAQSTFYRIARMKALYLILVICVLDVSAMSLYGDISLGMEKELMLDCALAFGLIVAVVTAMTSAFEIPRELREKTAQFILSKPTGRSAFVWGKFFGISALVVFNVAFVTVGSLAAYKLSFDEANWGIMSGAALVAAEGVALVGIGLFLSIVLPDALAAVALFAVFAIGHGIYMLPKYLGKVAEDGTLVESKAGGIIANVLPNLQNLDLKTEISNAVEIPNSFIGMGVLYGIAYALFATGLAVVIFSRKDIS